MRRCCTASRAGPMGATPSRCDPRLGRQPLRDYGVPAAHAVRAWCTSWIRPAMRRCCTPSWRGRWEPPQGGVIRDSAGNLYGTTAYGGGPATARAWCSSWITAGHETVLYTFTGGADGGYPEAGVIRDSAGNLYGTTNYGGTANARRGVQAGCRRAIRPCCTALPAGPMEATPSAGVIRDSAGNLYGTTIRRLAAEQRGSVQAGYGRP